VGRASSVLKSPRGAAFVALAAGLTAWYYAVDSVPALSDWWEVVLLACVLIPAVFSFDLIVLPLSKAKGLFPLSVSLGVLAVLATLADLEVLANFAKLAAVTFFAFWFLRFFEELVLLVIVALVIPWVDAYSVFRGPTGHIVSKHPHVFTNLSFAFPLPDGQTARLGLPDLLFFALFLAAADRFGLRVYATWVCLVASLGLTIAGTVWFDLSGLPALPGIALGFLVPNADLLWRRLRHEPGLGDRSDVPVGRPADDR
jgi:hypothetical protein